MTTIDQRISARASAVLCCDTLTAQLKQRHHVIHIGDTIRGHDRFWVGPAHNHSPRMEPGEVLLSTVYLSEPVLTLTEGPEDMACEGPNCASSRRRG
jgi:hypothetical protein